MKQRKKNRDDCKLKRPKGRKHLKRINELLLQNCLALISVDETKEIAKKTTTQKTPQKT